MKGGRASPWRTRTIVRYGNVRQEPNIVGMWGEGAGQTAYSDGEEKANPGIGAPCHKIQALQRPKQARRAGKARFAITNGVNLGMWGDLGDFVYTAGY